MTYPQRTLRTVATLAAVASLCLTATAAIVVTGDPNQPGTVTVQSTTELSFTVTTAGGVSGILFDNWVTSSDGRSTTLSGSSSISYRIDSGSATSQPVLFLVDNFAGDFASITATDGAAGWSSLLPVEVGQVVTVSPFSLTFAGQLNVGFNPLTVGTFTGNAFLFSGSGQQLSSLTATSPVPEPAEEAACAALGLVAFGVWRWRAARSQQAR